MTIGVFEYFPLSYPEDTIRDLQLRALAELHRVISPGGVLFIGTKNRLGWPYWTGAKDNSVLCFGSVILRWMVDLASRVLLQRAYRTVMYSSQGYTSLFNEAALIDLQFYRPVNGYRGPQTWLNPADYANIKAEI